MIRIFGFFSAIFLSGCSIISPYTDVAKSDIQQKLISIEKNPSLKKQPIKNIIFMIGDGMGLEHISAAWATTHRLNIENFQTIGLLKTYSANSFVTDSAAGGTALACGIKTNNGMIGMAPNKKHFDSILTFCQKQGKKVGIITTKSITDATPASFYAHNISRENETEIIYDLYNAKPDFVVAGGSTFLQEKKDNIPLKRHFKNDGYKLIFDVSKFLKKEKIKTPFLALLAKKNFESAKKRGPILEKATQLALDSLSKNKKGFFLIIESAKIDTEAHWASLNGVLNEIVDFDNTIGIALDFASKNPGTLVVVTADHSTGGLTILDGNLTKKEIKGHFSTHWHNGGFVPIYAFGSGEKLFSGIYENIDCEKKIKHLILDTEKK